MARYVEDLDNGWNHVMEELGELGDLTVEAGVLKEDAGKKEGGASLVDVAAYNEFGTGRIPPRPFLRTAADENRKKYGKIAASGISSIISGRTDAHAVAEMVGNTMEGDIKMVIGDRGKLAPNAPATVRRKGSDAPLIDTGRLRQSIHHKVRKS